MSQLPPGQTPLNQHSLEALELWLGELGAKKSNSDPSIWEWVMPAWSAEIKMQIKDIKITWIKDGEKIQCSFPYGLSREDVQSAISQGP